MGTEATRLPVCVCVCVQVSPLFPLPTPPPLHPNGKSDEAVPAPSRINGYPGRYEGKVKKIWKESSTSWFRARVPQGGTLNPAVSSQGSDFGAGRAAGTAGTQRGRGPVAPSPQMPIAQGKRGSVSPKGRLCGGSARCHNTSSSGAVPGVFSLSGVGEGVPVSLPHFPSRGCETSRGAVASSTQRGSAKPRVGPSGGPCITPETPKPPVAGVLGPTTLGARGGQGAGAGWGSPAAPTPGDPTPRARCPLGWGGGGSRSSCRAFL